MCGAHFPLNGGKGAVGVGNGLLLCYAADDAFAVLFKRHHGRGGAGSFRVGDDDGLAAFNDRNAGIGGSQVNTDDFCHINYLPVCDTLSDI